MPGQHVRGHSPAPAQGTQPCSADTPPAHNAPRTESTVQILHTMVAPTAVTDRRRRMAPTAMISSDAPRSPGTQPYLGGHSLTSGDTALLRGHSLTSGTHSHFGDTATLWGHSHTLGTQPHSGDTATLRGHSHAQGTQPRSGDTALPRGTQPHSGDTATLRGHTLPAPNAPHPARTAKTAHNCTQAQNQRLARPTAAGCPQRMAPPRTGLTPLTAASPAFAAVAASHATSGHSSHPSNGKTPAPQDAAESEKSPTQSPAESPQQQHSP